MNDRFGAQLRQHLLDTADERPAQDQLATVLGGVAVTPQRRAFVARLTWNTGPTVRYGLVALALIGALVATQLYVGGGPGPTPEPTTTPAPTFTPAPVPTALPPSEVPTVGPSPELTPCIPFDHEATYTANAGTLPVGVTVPATTSSPWSGLPTEFQLINAPCGGSGTVRFDAALVAHVYADFCHWKGSSVEAPTVPDVVAKLQAQAGHDTSAAIDTNIGAFRATRLDLSVPAAYDAFTCDDGVLGLWETSAGVRTVDPGATIQVYVAEVDGVTLVVTAGYPAANPPTGFPREIDTILASLHVDI